MSCEDARIAALCRRLACEYDELLALLRRGYSILQAEQLLEAPRSASPQGESNHTAQRDHRENKAN